jgi:hypothetical protein
MTISACCVTEYVGTYQGEPFQTVSIMEFRDGKVVHETQSLAELFPDAACRAQWVERAAWCPSATHARSDCE